MDIWYDVVEAKIEEYLDILEPNAEELSHLMDFVSIKAKWADIKLKKIFTNKYKRERIALEKKLLDFVMDSQRSFKYANATEDSPDWMRIARKSGMSGWDVFATFYANRAKLNSKTKKLIKDKTGLNTKDFCSLYFKWRILHKREVLNIDKRRNVKQAKQFKKFLEGAIELVGIDGI